MFILSLISVEINSIIEVQDKSLSLYCSCGCLYKTVKWIYLCDGIFIKKSQSTTNTRNNYNLDIRSLLLTYLNLLSKLKTSIIHQFRIIIQPHSWSVYCCGYGWIVWNWHTQYRSSVTDHYESLSLWTERWSGKECRAPDVHVSCYKIFKELALI